MKKIKFLSAFFLLASAVSFTSCSSDDGNDPVNPPASGTFTVDMDGEAFAATQAQATVTNGVMAIAGTRGTNGEAIVLMVQGTTTGTYPGTFMSYMPEAESPQFINVNPATVVPNGTVTISSVANNMVSGTFSFTAYDYQGGGAPIVFTNGSFNVPLTTINPPTGQAGVSFKIDGVQKNYTTAAVGLSNSDYVLAASNMATMEMIQINMKSTIAPGTYSIGGLFEDGPYAMVGSSTTGSIQSVQGTYTITGNSDGWLTGTFSFTGEDFDGNTVQVTNGTFNAPIAED